VERCQLELTAVIEPALKLGATDEEPERLQMYRFGVETMEGAPDSCTDDVGPGTVWRTAGVNCGVRRSFPVTNFQLSNFLVNLIF